MEPDQTGPPEPERRTVTIAVGNQKGGTGKTTVTINLAAALVARGRTVRGIDCDPQRGSASLWLPPTTSGLGDGLYDVYVNGASLDSRTGRTTVENLYIVPSDPKLRSVESQPSSVDVLVDALAASRAPVDYNLLDLAPNTSYNTLGALAASDYMVIPLQPSPLDKEGVDELVGIIERVQRVYNPGLKVLVFVVNRNRSNTVLHQGLIEYMIARYPDSAVHPIPETVQLQSAALAREPINTFEPRGKAAIAFAGLAELIEERIYADGR